MQFVFVYQREPHAGQLAFVDVQQPKDLGERVELARRTCTDMELAPASIWVDGMDDQSRALFGDLPSPAIVIDPLGVVRAKLPWAEPDALRSLLTQLAETVRGDVQAALASPATPTDEGRQRGARLWLLRSDPKAGLPKTDLPKTTATLAWIAAAGTLATDQSLPEGDPWLRLVALATLATEQPDDARVDTWLARLGDAEPATVAHWALQRRLELLRRDGGKAAQDTILPLAARLAALRREQPWLTPPR